MKKKIFLAFVILLGILFMLPVTVSATEPPPSSGSFTYGIATLYYDISGATLTGVVSEESEGELSIVLEGTYVPDTELTMDIKATVLDDGISLSAIMFLDAVCFDASDKHMPEFNEAGDSTNEDEGSVGPGMSMTVSILPPEKAQEVKLIGSYGYVIVYPSSSNGRIRISANLQPEVGKPVGTEAAEQEGETDDGDIPVLLEPQETTQSQSESEPAIVLPVEPEPSAPEPDPEPKPDLEPELDSDPESADEENQGGSAEHADLVESALISALAIIAAVLGGAAGSASAGMGAGMAGSVGFIPEPPSMVLTTTNGAQILVVQDPVTGEWTNSETGNLVDIGRHEEFVREQEQTLAQQRARDAELERTGQTAMQQGFDEIEQKYQQEFDAIQKEIDGRRREQLARDQENLEWEQKQAQRLSSIGRIAGDGLIGAARDTAELAKSGAEKVKKMGEWIAGTIRDPQKLVDEIGDAYNSAKKYLGEAKDSVIAKAEEIRNNPWIVVEGLKEGAKAVIDFASSPRKQWEFVKSVVGIDDFIASQDPNLSIGERVEKVLSGTFKLGITIGTGGAGGAGRTAATRTAVTRTAATRGAGKLATVKGIKPSLPVKTGRNYVAAKRSTDLRGMTKTAKKVVQNTADEMGLQIKARNIKSANAGRMIESGKAVPKRVNMKAKSLDILDEMLGGPKNSEGLVGYYKPKMPPKEVWNNLSPKTKVELTSKFKERSREFRKLSEPMKKLEAAGEYKLEGGLIRDLKQGGKFVTSDLDIHDIVNFYGTPVSESVKKEAYRKMMNYGKTPGKPPVQSTVMHEGTMSWTKTSDKIGYSEKAKQGLIDGATKEGPGKGITSFNPLAKPTSEKYVR